MHIWLCILGYANWALNIFPLLKPALNSSYDNVTGHTFLNAPIFLNKHTTEDLLWFADQVECLDGVWMFNSEIWDTLEADLQIWGDTSAIGLAFWSPSHNVAYIANPIVDVEHHFNVFYNEVLTILATLQWASTLSPLPKCLAIHTDSSTSFSIFNSLCAISLYNLIIFSSVKICLQSKIDLHVFFIKGKKNTMADALSCCTLSLACHLAPGLKILFFMPLQLSMGASLKWTFSRALWPGNVFVSLGQWSNSRNSEPGSLAALLSEQQPRHMLLPSFHTLPSVKDNISLISKVSLLPFCGWDGLDGWKPDEPLQPIWNSDPLFWQSRTQ